MFDGGASNFLRSFGVMNRQSGHGGEENVARWQQGIGRVRPDDLRALGLDTLTMNPLEDVDPAAMKFDAMMALKKAQRSGMPTRLAEQRLQDAETASAGVDEVLRRRQKGFNDYTASVQRGDTPAYTGNAYDGATSNAVAGQTGAALASAARAGRPSALPQEDRPMSVAEHFAARPSYAQLGTPGASLGRNNPQSILSGLGRARTGY